MEIASAAAFDGTALTNPDGTLLQAMGGRLQRLEQLREQLETRTSKVESFTTQNAERVERVRHLARASAIEKHEIAQQIGKMKAFRAANGDASRLSLTVPTHVRENLSRPDLQLLFEKCTPSADGT